MSVLQRVQRHHSPDQITADQTSQGMSSTSLVVVDPPVVARLRVVLAQLAKIASSSPDDKYSRYSWILSSVTDDILDDMIEGLDQAELGEWFAKFGAIIAWCGHGDASQLPPEVQPFLGNQYQQLAITAGAD